MKWCVTRAFSLLELLVVIAIISILMALTMAGVQKVRAAAARTVCQNHIRQLALAGQSYHAAHGRFPVGTGGEDKKEPYPFLNWHARLLPYLEQSALWTETDAAYKQDRDFLHNPPHTAQTHPMPVFGCPADPRLRDPVTYSVSRVHSLTSYMGVNGLRATKNDGVLFLDSQIRTGDITDGTSNTLFIGERPPGGKNLSLGWWYAGWGTDKNGEADGHLGVRVRFTGRYGDGCPGGPFEYKARTINDPCGGFQFWSLHPGGAHFAFADGSVHFLSYSADAILPALATRAGGETVELP